MAKKFFGRSAVFIVLIFLFIYCGGGGSPDGIPKSFYAAMAKGDVDAMKKMTTGGFTTEAVRSAEQMKNMKVSISDWKVREVKEIGPDKKTVRVEYVSKVAYKSGRGFPRKMKQDQIFHLKKVDKKWLIEKIRVASPPVSVD